MREAKECVVRAHFGKHVQTIPSNHELKRTSAGNFFSRYRNIIGVKQLDDCTSRVRVFLEELENIIDLILAPGVKKPWAIATVYGLVILGIVLVLMDVVTIEGKILGCILFFL